jgi:hypothetical protein
MKVGLLHDFIYDPETGHAQFVDTNPRGYSLVRTADRIRLWVRNNKLEPFSKIREQAHFQSLVPLLKSHLQKAVRRQELEAALSTAFTMILFDKASLVRRLPIIAIEDVELIHGTSIIVWLMMAGDSYKWCEEDVRHVLGYVQQLCIVNSFHQRDPSEATMSHSVLSTLEGTRRDELLALFYRMKWGGTDGDVKMLEQSIQTYYKNDTPIAGEHRQFTDHLPDIIDIDYNSRVFIKDAIDFHCFPSMLQRISGLTCVPKERVKQLIWHCHSAINNRKQYTIDNAAKHKSSRDYSRIKDYIDSVRQALLLRLSDNIEN